ELDAAELLRHTERADADLFGAFENLLRQPVFRRHHPFALPVVADERDDHVVDEAAARLPHEVLFFRQVVVRPWRFPHKSIPRVCGEANGNWCGRDVLSFRHIFRASIAMRAKTPLVPPVVTLLVLIVSASALLASGPACARTSNPPAAQDAQDMP